MRELALLDEEEGAADAFADLHELSLTCRFTNCDHEKSAGCALQAGLNDGTIDPERFLRYRKLRDREERVRRVRY
jgi:ribosome biogenesis GTPase